MRALCDATVEELAAVGFHDLTVRSVARRAGVAPATAYTYFASKDHLVAEVFWRRVDAQDDPPPDRRRSPARRAAEVLQAAALVVADEAELAAACTVALLADDVEVAELRRRIGGDLHRRLRLALDDDVSSAAVTTLEFVLSGALISVGTGHLSYEQLPDVLSDAADLVLGGRS